MKNAMDVDKIFHALGNPGRHSIITFILLCSNYFPIVLNHLSVVIYGSPVPHHCVIPEGFNTSDAVPQTAAGKLDSCHVYKNYSQSSNETLPCPNGWKYDPLPREKSIVMEVRLSFISECGVSADRFPF